ncbi:hypothetical protein HDV06_007057 [Boothiomyces sp. JEL0866]|nr:hypothetical protein HDV06_007057 [Boothiomyces sp. JEL0866]
MTISRPNLTEIRSQFPMIKNNPDWAFFENAGGSQVPHCVINSITKYLSETNVQLNAGYLHSNEADKVIQECRKVEKILMNATDGHIILGPSTSILLENLANSFVASAELTRDHSVIIAQAAHEANSGPWKRAARKTSAKLLTWNVDPTIWDTCPIANLAQLLDSSTRIVAFPHVSNIIGQVVPLKEIVAMIRKEAPNASIVVDGVAYAPHLAMDVTEWDVDFYAYSHYKLFGPHMASLYGKANQLEKLVGANHHFTQGEIPYRFELGGLNHELCAGRVGLKEYLMFLAGSAAFNRQCVLDAFEYIQELETLLLNRVYDFLSSLPNVQVYTSKCASKVATISFSSPHLSSIDIVKELHRHKVAVRSGHMYAFDLVVDAMKRKDDGVVRISMLHYNTLEEVDCLVSTLKDIFNKSV